MTNQFALLLAICLVVSNAGCAHDVSAPDAAVEDDSFNELNWRVTLDPDRPVASTLTASSPRNERTLPGLLARAEPLARLAVTSRTPLLGPAANSANLELRSINADPLGGARVRFSLRVAGVRIDGGDAIVVLGPDGAVRSISGWFPEFDALSGHPVIDAPTAESMAVEIISERWSDADVELEDEAELVALPQGSRLRPCWRAVVNSEGPTGAFRRELFIDAEHGSVALEREGFRGSTVSGTGVGVTGLRKPLTIDLTSSGRYRLVDTSRHHRGIQTASAEGRMSSNGTIVMSDDPDHWDEEAPGAGAAVDAHAHAAIVFDFLRDKLGRNSWDGRGGKVGLVVHYGEEHANAFWDGTRAVFGDGDGYSTLPFSGALDVVAHELFHGVISKEAALVYERQSGALDESLADVFGTLVEGENWLIGEDISDDPLRDLEAPWLLGYPGHMEDYVTSPVTPDGDMGAVHANSTIPSHAAFLVAAGGTHPRSLITVKALGKDKLRLIWWRALSIYLAPRARFRDFAEATRASAADLFGNDAMEVRAVTDAWRAVGVMK